MIKKYDDNYIDLSKVLAVGKIEKYDKTYTCDIYIDKQIFILSDTDKERLSALRERLVKDWMAVKNARD